MHEKSLEWHPMEAEKEEGRREGMENDVSRVEMARRKMDPTPEVEPGQRGMWGGG